MSDYDKPECYGDYGQYDPHDDECQECDFVNGCGIRSMRNKKNDYEEDEDEDRKPASRTIRSSRYRPATTSRSKGLIESYRSSKTKSKTIEEDPSEDDTFLDILRHNASIEAVQAVFDEIANSVRHIPRKTYSNFRRKKR